ncbi:MAG: GntR family transcriptional regulator [Chloroflexota bacterium]|nr:GntR family transcriptional regulator [Chloroflexota bacterium]
MINRHSFVPIYVQIAQTIVQTVQADGLTYGEQLPSERDLAEQHQVSRLTARQAIDELVKRGVAYRVQGKGTFLARPQIRQASGLMSFSDELLQRGFQPSSKIILHQRVDASKSVAQRFQIAAGDPVLQLNRVRLANGQPVAVEYASLNLHLLPNLDQEDFEGQSLFAVIRGRYNVYPAWAEAEMEARLATDAECKWLDIPTGQAVLVAHRLTFTEAFELIEAVDSVYPGDRFPIYIGRQRILTELDEKA